MPTRRRVHQFLPNLHPVPRPGPEPRGRDRGPAGNNHIDTPRHENLRTAKRPAQARFRARKRRAGRQTVHVCRRPDLVHQPKQSRQLDRAHRIVHAHRLVHHLDAVAEPDCATAAGISEVGRSGPGPELDRRGGRRRARRGFMRGADRFSLLLG